MADPLNLLQVMLAKGTSTSFLLSSAVAWPVGYGPSATELTGFMIATKESLEPHSSDALPNSRRVYAAGQIHAALRVPMREITLTPTKAFNGQIEVNEPVRVYDCSGPWGDPAFHGDVTQGLPALRRDWILSRGDVEECDGRPVQAIDDGYLSSGHQEWASDRDQSSALDPRLSTLPKRAVLRAKPGQRPTQLAYARQGIITPEMEFIAIRENQGAEGRGQRAEVVRNDLRHQHVGADSPSHRFAPSIFARFPQRIPKEITP